MQPMEGIVAPSVIRKERDMAGNTVAQMTQSEFKEMLEAVVETTVEQKLLEILGDPDEGLQIKEAVQDRLLRQRESVASGRYGQSFEGVVEELGLD
jgi:vacuolar-type H+-ATPase subunit E/Vma4